MTFDYSLPHKIVDGQPILLTQAEIDEIEAARLADEVAQPKRLIRQQILALESQVTQRRLREAVLGTDNGWLSDIESQIAALRSQL